MPLYGVLLAAGVVLGTSASASAHVEVTAPGAAPGGPATLLFAAESENPEAGIRELATQLPAGMTGAGATLESGPAGWTLTVTEDVLVVGGEPLPAGEDAKYAIAVATLPETGGQLFLPTVQRYADGREDAWIEPATADLPDPAMPAPVLVLGATGQAAAPTAEGDPSPTVDAARPPDYEDGGGGGTAWYAGFGVLAVLALAGGAWFWRHRAGGAA